ncbi:DDE_3 domain-containing protein [Trichonephila clavipes]|nr:DDE_3 domain-containing protein [Trichonephila clavipes]
MDSDIKYECVTKNCYRKTAGNWVTRLQSVCPKPLLTEFQHKRRLTWAREHLLWTIKDWEKCLKPTKKYPTKVMVWGCMSSHVVGRLHIVSGTVKAMDYIEKLQNKLLPTARNLLGNQSWIFQDDNVPCHRAKVVQKWLKDHNVNRMNWSGQSPDTLIRYRTYGLKLVMKFQRKNRQTNVN